MKNKLKYQLILQKNKVHFNIFLKKYVNMIFTITIITLKLNIICLYIYIYIYIYILSKLFFKFVILVLYRKYYFKNINDINLA